MIKTIMDVVFKLCVLGVVRCLGRMIEYILLLWERVSWDDERL